MWRCIPTPHQNLEIDHTLAFSKVANKQRKRHQNIIMIPSKLSAFTVPLPLMNNLIFSVFEKGCN